MSRTIEAFIRLHGIQKGFEGVAGELEKLIQTPICVDNCGLCCEVNTPRWTALEAMNAITVLAGNGTLDEALKRAEDWLIRKDVATSYEGLLAGCYVPPKINAEYTAISQTPCPMLTDEKKCLVHAARPLACRAYGVTRSCSGFCPRPAGKGEPVTDRMYMKCPELRADIEALWKEAKEINPRFIIQGFMPTMLFRAGREAKFYELAYDNKIASAKIVGTDIDSTLLWQEQYDALRKGVLPDLVIAGVYNNIKSN